MEARRAAGLTQAGLAVRAGVSRQQIQRLEAGSPGTLLMTYVQVKLALKELGHGY